MNFSSMSLLASTKFPNNVIHNKNSNILLEYKERTLYVVNLPLWDSWTSKQDSMYVKLKKDKSNTEVQCHTDLRANSLAAIVFPVPGGP